MRIKSAKRLLETGWISFGDNGDFQKLNDDENPWLVLDIMVGEEVGKHINNDRYQLAKSEFLVTKGMVEDKESNILRLLNKIDENKD